MAVTWITAADLNNPTSEYAEAAAESASWILYKLTAEKYAGLRNATEWVGLDNADPYQCLTFTDYGDFTWVSAHANAANTQSVRLRGRPVRSITSVVTASGVAASADYQLVNNALLVRTDGVWDLAQGIIVSYSYGVLPPAAGIMAAKRLGNELLAAVEPGEDGECSLPQRVIQSVDRQGISYTILDPQTFLEEGRTGMYEVDLFIKAANPHNARKRPRVFSPDIPKGRRTT